MIGVERHVFVAVDQVLEVGVGRELDVGFEPVWALDAAAALRGGCLARFGEDPLDDRPLVDWAVLGHLS